MSQYEVVNTGNVLIFHLLKVSLRIYYIDFYIFITKNLNTVKIATFLRKSMLFRHLRFPVSIPFDGNEIGVFLFLSKTTGMVSIAVPVLNTGRVFMVVSFFSQNAKNGSCSCSCIVNDKHPE